jgi:hypothetical protein
MALPIQTFSNQSGGFSYFKALGHPLAVTGGAAILKKIRTARRAAVYDPLGQLTAFSALHGLRTDDFTDCFVRDTFLLNEQTLGHDHRPVTELAHADIDVLFMPVFDAGLLLDQISGLLPAGCVTVTLDEMRIPGRLLTNKRNYLDKLNFATNFAFFRDEAGKHSRLVTANYWGGYGAKGTFLWCRLFAGSGDVLLDFEVPLQHANQTVVIDSRQLRAEHGLSDFCGQLFISVVNGAGHDIVKYVIDTGGGEEEVSCTHDANAWPADLYAGLPAPMADEKVLLWVQNSHPVPIAASEIGLNLMGDNNIAWLDEEIAPFASCAVDVSSLLPNARWPQQLEIQAGKWFVRPRYEIIKAGRSRINHPNVERNDLQHDENIRRLTAHLGKGFILPAPILPPDEFVSECLPTPMSTAQTSLPIITVAYDADGNEIAREALGNLPRNHTRQVDLTALAANIPAGGGHVELQYDLDANGVMDGWLHALFRYTDKRSGHGADTSFGAHLFNHIMTFRSEPQSYKGPPPGLSTRLFLLLMPAPARVFCHLTYAVCSQWHAYSSTILELKNAAGEDVSRTAFSIPANGSRLFFADEMFNATDLQQAGDNGYILVRDSTCRLFGYHGVRQNSGFALDHMFGF